MFEEHDKINEFDLMMKSILDEGQEDVPASGMLCLKGWTMLPAEGP